METIEFPFIIIIFLSFALTLFTLWKKQKHTTPQNSLPPGPWKLPFIGSLHHIAGAHPYHVLRDLSRKYGPLMHMQLGEISAVICSSPQSAKAILKTHDLAFSSRPQSNSTDIIFYKNTDISYSPFGDYWKQMRRICILELLSAKMVKSFDSIRHDELSTLISSITAMAKSGGRSVNMTQKIFWFTSSTTCRAAFGQRCRDPERLIILLRELMALLAGFDVADFFPSKKWIHSLTGKKSRVLKMHGELDQILESIIGDHKENREIAANGEDIVNVLLRLMEGGELQFPVTHDNIKAVVLDILTAGPDTSTSTIIWALIEMVRRPIVMSKAQAEVRKVLKGKKTLDEKDMQELKYLQFVIKETLRLHPAAPFLHRKCREETKINGYAIPPNTKVMVNVWAIGRDPSSWEDPESFNPDRFKKNCVDFTGNDYQFIPFGAGKRSCPGMLFGLANVVQPLAQLLYHFDWRLPDGVSAKEFDMTESVGITVARQEDLYLIAIPLQ